MFTRLYQNGGCDSIRPLVLIVETIRNHGLFNNSKQEDAQMKRSNRRTFRLKQMLTRRFIGCAVVIAFHSAAVAGPINFLDWTASTSGSNQLWSNTSSAGTITGTSTNWGAPTGTFGMPTAIDGPLTFTTEFNANGNVSGSSVNFIFSSSFGWGTGGELILGNIHNFFEYTLSAFDSAGNPININSGPLAWTVVPPEYQSTAPGSSGYFSTSSTRICSSGTLPDGSACAGGPNSEAFYVYDTSASAGSGQGGVLVLSGLQNVERIQLTLASNNLGNMFPTGGQGSDFIIFNVGTPTPEPSSAVLIGTGVVGMLAVLRRRRRGRVA